MTKDNHHLSTDVIELRASWQLKKDIPWVLGSDSFYLVTFRLSTPTAPDSVDMPRQTRELKDVDIILSQARLLSSYSAHVYGKSIDVLWEWQNQSNFLRRSRYIYCKTSSLTTHVHVSGGLKFEILRAAARPLVDF